MSIIARLMKRFIYTAGITGLMQVATLIIMTRVATQRARARPPGPRLVANGRRFPPVAELATVSLALVVIGGILLASYAPRRPPLGVLGGRAAVSTILLLADVGPAGPPAGVQLGPVLYLLPWALLAYDPSAGMIGFAFIHDHVRVTRWPW